MMFSIVETLLGTGAHNVYYAISSRSERNNKNKITESDKRRKCDAIEEFRNRSFVCAFKMAISLS